jgi:hypothetical protein
MAAAAPVPGMSAGTRAATWRVFSSMTSASAGGPTATCCGASSPQQPGVDSITCRMPSTAHRPRSPSAGRGHGRREVSGDGVASCAWRNRRCTVAA